MNDYDMDSATETPLHATIEQNLIKAYQRYLASLDA